MKAERYPACETCGAHHRYGVSHDAWLRWKERLATAHVTRTHYVQPDLTPAIRAKIGAASLGRRHTAATKAKLAVLGRGRVASPATRALLSASTTALWRNPDWARKARARVGRRPTTLEKTVYSWLNDLGIYFHREQPIIGGLVDIFCPGLNFGIEVDGEYWHPEGNERDQRKDFERGMATVRCIRLRERDIRSGAAREYLMAVIAEQETLQRDLAAIRAGAWRAAA